MAIMLQIAANQQNSIPLSGQGVSNATPWIMKGGTEVLIRPISPEDEPLMVKFHQTLSDRTVYLRYFCSLSFACRSSHERLARICFADPAHETVLVAIQRDVRMKQEKILGVGRLNKSADDKSA